MKKLFLITLLSITVQTFAQSTWKVDASHSSINFAVSHLVISETTGSFDVFEITAKAGDNFSNPEFEVAIETASINTKNKRRDNHLRADDFFDAKQYPKITFKSNSFKKTGDKTFVVTGNISIKGKTKQVQFNGKLNGVITDNYSKKQKAGLKLSTTLKRTDFNVGSPGGSVGEDVEVTINLEMQKQ